MAVNRQTLLDLAPIEGMLSEKQYAHGVSYGLSEAGYDIRIKQDITFCKRPTCTNDLHNKIMHFRSSESEHNLWLPGRFTIASAMERFQMPNTLTGLVKDKSTWARRGLSVFNTVIEPGWEGFLTLELVYHGEEGLIIPAGSGIAQVIFEYNTDVVAYKGRYQGQKDEPVAAIRAETSVL
jgi:dCTP deaminase